MTRDGRQTRLERMPALLELLWPGQPSSRIGSPERHGNLIIAALPTSPPLPGSARYRTIAPAHQVVFLRRDP